MMYSFYCQAQIVCHFFSSSQNGFPEAALRCREGHI